MSLAITIITPEGIIQAADSRVSIPIKVTDEVMTYSHFDNATKLLTFEPPHNHISVATYGAGTIGARTAHSFIKEFQKTLPTTRISTRKFALNLQTFYKTEWEKIEDNPQDSPMVFQIAGINNNQQFGEVYVVSVPGDEEPQKVISNGDFSLYYGGDQYVVDRLIQGRDTRLDGKIIGHPDLDHEKGALLDVFSEIQETHLLPLGSYALQDAIDLARFLIDTTAKMQKLSLNLKSVGGAIDISCITKADGCEMISKKRVV
jgi:hypothetical protein